MQAFNAVNKRLVECNSTYIVSLNDKRFEIFEKKVKKIGISRHIFVFEYENGISGEQIVDNCKELNYI